MSRLLSILLLACVLFISPVSAFLDMQSNAIFFDGKGHNDQVINGILDLICATKYELLIQMYGFSGHDEVKPIFDALKEARLRNVRIKIYLSQDAGRNEPNIPKGFPEKELEGCGIEVRWKREKSIDMHRKLWLSDGRTVFIGSSNISNNSFNSNDEVDIRLQDPAIGDKIRGVFYADWQDACETWGLKDCQSDN
jgi:phosphatidylserine/phosphatidylglycerophosphate/cardiolipin synthase-like enzyme